MAVTTNTMTGINGTKKDFPFTFPYLKTSDLKVELFDSSGGRKELDSTKFSFANATTISLSATSATDWQETTGAPKSDVTGNVYRETPSESLVATFYPGSAIRSADLNDNYTQNLYSTQEAENDASNALDNSRVLESGVYVTAVAKAAAAVTTANTANTTAGNAVTTANTANTTAGNAVTTANTANTTAGNAVTTANTANTTAGSAVTTANGAVTTANGAVTTANSAVTSAATANTTAGNAVTTANTANTTAGNAVTTANTANTTAGNAVTTSNTANTTAGSAVTTANSAVTTANAAAVTANSAAATVAASAIYQVVANFAALPSLASVDNNKFYQVNDSTLIQNESTVSGEPAGFTGDDELAVKLKSNTTASPKVWVWQEYFATDPETRYRKKLIVENLTTISEDYTIGTGNNGFSIGPVTISATKTITIPANSKYVVMN